MHIWKWTVAVFHLYVIWSGFCVCSQSVGQACDMQSQPVTARTWWCVRVPLAQCRETFMGTVPVAEQHTHSLSTVCLSREYTDLLLHFPCGWERKTDRINYMYIASWYCWEFNGRIYWSALTRLAVSEFYLLFWLAVVHPDVIQKTHSSSALWLGT